MFPEITSRIILHFQLFSGLRSHAADQALLEAVHQHCFFECVAFCEEELPASQLNQLHHSLDAIEVLQPSNLEGLVTKSLEPLQAALSTDPILLFRLHTRLTESVSKLAASNLLAL